MNKQEIYRKAANGEGQIMSYLWGAHYPRARVQIVHDMGDYACRYEKLAQELTSAGYEVLANDIAGHGMSKQGHRGAFADQEDSFRFILEDMDSLFTFAEADAGPLPRVLIGFGLGELLAEVYAADHPGLSMLILAGAISRPAGLTAIRASMASHIRRFGHSSVSEYVHNSMFQTGKMAGTEGDGSYYWLSSDPEEVRSYVRDEDCGFMLSASAYREMLRAFRRMRNPEGASRIPDIPIYVISGAQDQLGACGKTPRDLCTLLGETGHGQVAMHLYREAYHDLMHEYCTDEVISDIITMLERRL